MKLIVNSEKFNDELKNDSGVVMVISNEEEVSIAVVVCGGGEFFLDRLKSAIQTQFDSEPSKLTIKEQMSDYKYSALVKLVDRTEKITIEIVPKY